MTTFRFGHRKVTLLILAAPQESMDTALMRVCGELRHGYARACSLLAPLLGVCQGMPRAQAKELASYLLRLRWGFFSGGSPCAPSVGFASRYGVAEAMAISETEPTGKAQTGITLDCLVKGTPPRRV